MEDYSEPVSDSVWNAVASDVTSVWDRQRRSRRRRRMFAGAGAFAAAAVAAFFVLSRGAGDNSPLPSEIRLLASAEVPGLDGSLFGLPSPSGLEFPASRSVSAASVETLPVSEAHDYEDAQETGGAVEEIPDADDGRPAGTSSAGSRSSADEEWDLPTFSGEDDRSRVPRLALNVSASNVASMSSRSNGYGGMYGSVVAPALSAQRDQVNSYSSVLLGNNSREVGTSTRFWQPVSLGVTASLALGQVFSVESGLNYSCLVSDMSSGTDENRYDIRQTLHYVGIPLRARVSFWNPGRLEFYLSAGGAVEKCVYGTTSTRYIVNSSLSSMNLSRVNDDRFQWSLGASAGIGYRFSDLIGLYAEPGITWYIPNGGFVENVYRERPLNFSIALGLRFNLGRD